MANKSTCRRARRLTSMTRPAPAARALDPTAHVALCHLVRGRACMTRGRLFSQNLAKCREAKNAAAHPLSLKAFGLSAEGTGWRLSCARARFIWPQEVLR
jgi:hypothetical protein